MPRRDRPLEPVRPLRDERVEVEPRAEPVDVAEGREVSGVASAGSPQTSQ
jgi:hypothetical protein